MSATVQSVSRGAVPANPRSRVILASLIGTTIEFYDFYVYATAAVLVFPHLFFPAGNETTALLASFAVFGAAMVARPLGAIFFGHLGDRRGRKITLVGALLTMGIATFLIGCLPTYPTAGWLAPALLVVLRLAQGFALGGEWSGAALVATENAPANKRAIYGTFPQLGAPIGFIIANGLFLVMAALLPSNDPSTPSQAFLSWGWRIPFLIGGVLAVIVFWLRRRLAETESFEKRGGGQSSIFALFRHHPREAGLVMLLTAGGTLAFYAYSIYLQKFLVNTSGFDRATAAQINAAALFGFMLIQPLAGALSDRIGRKPLMIGFGVLGVLLTWPIFTTLESVRSPMLAFLIMLGALAIVTGYTSINAVVKAELFPAHIRTLGVALPYAVANALFGGTAEYVALWFKDAGWERGFYWSVTAMIGVSLATYLGMRDTAKHSRILED